MKKPIAMKKPFKHQRHAATGIALLCAAFGGARVLLAGAQLDQLTSESYACKEHLIAQWDAIENAGRGAHSDKPASWVELVGGISVSGSQNLTYNDKSVKFSGGAGQYFTCHIPALKTALANKSCTIEMRLRPTEYFKYSGIFQVGSLTARELILDQREETGSGSAKCAFGGLQYAASGWTSPGEVCPPKNDYFGKDVMATVTVDADGAHLAYDGGEIVHTNPGRNVAPTLDDFSVGLYGGNSPAKMEVQTIRIYDTVLTREQSQYNLSVDRLRFSTLGATSVTRTAVDSDGCMRITVDGVAEVGGDLTCALSAVVSNAVSGAVVVAPLGVVSDSAAHTFTVSGLTYGDRYAVTVRGTWRHGETELLTLDLAKFSADTSPSTCAIEEVTVTASYSGNDPVLRLVMRAKSEAPSCTWAVRIGTAADRLMNELTDESWRVTGAGEFTVTNLLVEADGTAARCLKPGAAVYCRVVLTGEGEEPAFGPIASATIPVVKFWEFDRNLATSPQNPALWTNELTWTSHFLYPNGYYSIASNACPTSSRRYLRVPDEGVTLHALASTSGSLYTDSPFLAITGGPIYLRPRNVNGTVLKTDLKTSGDYMRVFSDIIVPDKVSGDKMDGGTGGHTDSLEIRGYGGAYTVLGRISCAGTAYVPAGAWYQRFDRANSMGEVLVNPCPTNRVWLNSDAGARWEIYAPRGSSTAKSIANCETVLGSTFVTTTTAKAFLSGTTPQVPAGALITGEGIPEGARIRNIIAGNVIEIDKPATASATGVTLTIQPYQAKLYHTIARFGQRSEGGGLSLNKWNETDILRFTVTDLLVGQGYQGYSGIPLNRSTSYAGTLVLNGPVATKGDTYICFNNTDLHLEFATNALGVAGFSPTNRVADTGLRFYLGKGTTNLNNSAVLTVPDVGVKTLPVPLLYWFGKYTKDGAGELTGMARNIVTDATSANVSQLTVKEGGFDLLLNQTLVDGGKTFAFKNLTVCENAEFSVGTTNATVTADAGSAEGCVLRMAAGSSLTFGSDYGAIAPRKIVLEVGADGSLPSITATAADLSSGGTIELRGDCSNLAVGDHTVLRGAVTRGEAWTCVTEAPHRIFKVKVGENGLVLRVSCPGMMLLVK